MNAEPGSTSQHVPALTYAVVDDLAFASNSLSGAVAALPYQADALGPQIELALLAMQGAVPPLHSDTLTPLMRSLGHGPRNRLVEWSDSSGMIRLSSDPMTGTEWTRLSIVAKRSAAAAGFDKSVAGRLAVAVEEMASNIIEHSHAVDTGVIAFRGANGVFEFVVADRGIGALASLQSNPKFVKLQSAREALPLVIQDGCSRLPEPNRGNGFCDLFRGLANHNGNLRFRSGDAAVLIDGQSPSPLRPKVKPKAPLSGFMASVICAVK